MEIPRHDFRLFGGLGPETFKIEFPRHDFHVFGALGPETFKMCYPRHDFQVFGALGPETFKMNMQSMILSCLEPWDQKPLKWSVQVMIFM